MKLVTNTIKLAGATLAALSAIASLQAVTISFDTGGTNVGGSNNTRTFTSGSLSVSVSAWSRLENWNGSIQNSYTQSYLGQYAGNGLGVTNDSEFDLDPAHKVDNLNGYDFLLFSFNQQVDINSVELRSVGSIFYDDSDFRLWIGSTGVLTTLDDGTFEDSLGGGSPRIANVNAGNVLGSHFLLGAIPITTGSNPDDQFKVYNMNVTVPNNNTPGVPDGGSTAALMGLGLMGLAALRKRFL